MAVAIDDRMVDFRTDLFRVIWALMICSGKVAAQPSIVRVTSAPRHKAIGAEHCGPAQGPPVICAGWMAGLVDTAIWDGAWRVTLRVNRDEYSGFGRFPADHPIGVDPVHRRHSNMPVMPTAERKRGPLASSRIRAASSRVPSPPTCPSSNPTKFELVINLRTAKALGLWREVQTSNPATRWTSSSRRVRSRRSICRSTLSNSDRRRCAHLPSDARARGRAGDRRPDARSSGTVGRERQVQHVT